MASSYACCSKWFASEVIITLFKPSSFSDGPFSERMKEMEKVMEIMKQTIEKQ